MWAPLDELSVLPNLLTGAREYLLSFPHPAHPSYDSFSLGNVCYTPGTIIDGLWLHPICAPEFFWVRHSAVCCMQLTVPVSSGVARIWCKGGTKLKRKFFRGDATILWNPCNKQWQIYRPVYSRYETTSTSGGSRVPELGGPRGGHRFLWGGPPSPSLSRPLSLPSLLPLLFPPLSPSSLPLPSP